MNIVIDPYFLELEKEKEIKANIIYFQTLVFLCTSGKVSVYLYKDLVGKINSRAVRPFPIQIGEIHDEKLRETIIHLNNAFTYVIMNNIKKLDIEECGGNQNFEITSEQSDTLYQLKNDEKYYELLSVLLHPCYNKQLDLSEYIITGHIDKGRKIGDKFTLLCKCEQSFKATYIFESIEKIESAQDKAFLKLRKLERENAFSTVKSPTIIRSEHHNKLQNNSRYKTFEGLSRVNKVVLDLLRQFGLYKVIFADFHEDSSRPMGTIISCHIQPTDDGDIVKGWLYAETGFKNRVELYFPKSVGENLMLYLDNEFSKDNVERLIDLLL